MGTSKGDNKNYGGLEQSKAGDKSDNDYAGQREAAQKVKEVSDKAAEKADKAAAKKDSNIRKDGKPLSTIPQDPDADEAPGGAQNS